MTNHEPRETRILTPHPNSEQKGLVTEVVVPLAQTGITVGGMIGAAKIASKPNDDGKS
jgi:hypothetical protein